MTKGLLVSRRKKNILYKDYLHKRCPLNYEIYKKYRNVYNKVLRACKINYYECKLAETQKDPKATWKFLNESINRKSSKSAEISDIKINGVSVTESSEIANGFNTFFSTVANEIRESIPTSSIPGDLFLTDFTNDEFKFEKISPEMIQETILQIETKTSLDIDGLNTKVLKSVASCIACPLAHIFNLSFESGLVPTRLKVSRTVPVFKAGASDIFGNYRPISCLPVLSKIIEKLVCRRLNHYLVDNGLLYNFQFGFQAGKSTVHPLVHILNYIAKAFNNNEFVVSVFLDFQKAFDLVDHSILLKKLSKLGIHGLELKWFENYLKDRKQFVMVNGILSNFATFINISVLQGSILGPLLFLCFINDMHLSNQLVNFHFADDTTALAKGQSLNELVQFVNYEIQKLGIWLRANKLSINAAKTKIMIFHSKGKVIPDDLLFWFNNNDLNCIQDPSRIYPIERISNKSSPHPAFKILGVWLDENLTFDHHVSATTKKISKSLFCLNRVKNILSDKALKSLYYALIHPYFLYCMPVYCCTKQKNINALLSIQKRCIRLISKAKYNAHTDPLYFALNILPIPDLIEQQRLQLMHSLEYEYCPASFADEFTKNIENRVYLLRNNDDYFIPQTRLNSLKQFPLVSFPLAWNNLDSSLKTIVNKHEFKFRVKQLFLDKYKAFECKKLFCYTCSNH